MGFQCCAQRQQTLEEAEKPEESDSHPSAREKEKPQVTVAQDFIPKCPEKTKTDFILFTIFALALRHGDIFVSLFFHLLLLLDKI